MPGAKGRARVRRDIMEDLWIVGGIWCYGGVVEVMFGEKNFTLL
jgi:hypothetical protein